MNEKLFFAFAFVSFHLVSEKQNLKTTELHFAFSLAFLNPKRRTFMTLSGFLRQEQGKVLCNE